jgi:hypothetical protein
MSCAQHCSLALGWCFAVANAPDERTCKLHSPAAKGYVVRFKGQLAPGSLHMLG